MGVGGTLVGMGERGLADPRTIFPGIDARLQALHGRIEAVLQE